MILRKKSSWSSKWKRQRCKEVWLLYRCGFSFDGEGLPNKVLMLNVLGSLDFLLGRTSAIPTTSTANSVLRMTRVSTWLNFWITSKVRNFMINEEHSPNRGAVKSCDICKGLYHHYLYIIILEQKSLKVYSFKHILFLHCRFKH